MTQKNQAIFSILAFCVLLAAAFLTITWVSPPAPLPADVPAAKFSANRAMHDLEIIARQPHPIGASAAHTAVRDYLLGEMRLLGLEPQVQETFSVITESLESGYIAGGFVENILVRLPGTNPQGAILLMAHYDSAPGVPGAVDSGSAVVTNLELLRALRAGPPLRQDVIVLFSDGEEPGTLGARAFVTQHPWFPQVKFVINMDQFWEGPPMLVRSSMGNGLLVQALARSGFSTRPAYLSFPFDLFPSGDTDLSPFVLAGVSGAEIDGGGPFAEKHTVLDRPEIVDPGSLQQIGNQMLALIRHLGSQPSLETTMPDQTFFPVMGILIHYPSHWAWPFAFMAGLCYLGLIVYGFQKGEFTWRGLGVGLVVSLFSIALSVLTTNLIWRGILTLHPEYAYDSAFLFRQKLSDDYLFAIGFMVLAFAIVVSSFFVAGKKINVLDFTVGALAIWFPLMIAAVILIPATSYLFTWVVLAVSLALLFDLSNRTGKYAWILSGLGFLVSAILSAFLWLPLFYIAILSGPMSADSPLLSMMVGLVALWLGSMLPILDRITAPKRWLLSAAACFIALGFLAAGHSLVGKGSPPPLVNPVGYWLDANHDTAYWLAFSDELDERQAGLLLAPIQQDYTNLFSEAPQHSVLTSAAPIINLDGPQLEVLSDERVSDRHVVKVRIIPSLNERLMLFTPKNAPLMAIILPDNARIELNPGDTRGWVFRFDGIPPEGIEITFELAEFRPFQFFLVEEKTGLPSFPGLTTQPEPGTMKSPGVFTQAIPTDFTAITRKFVIQEILP
jgi:hypothetical protein